MLRPFNLKEVWRVVERDPDISEIKVVKKTNEGVSL
jgi:sulfopyruvate decarboxylase TPP-binding subunit